MQDNRNPKREQGVSGDSQDQPGDICHPDFSDGRSTFFDISIRDTLHPEHTNEASVSAGVAAPEGERRKDGKHRLRVEECGGRLVPLVVETLGLWTPYAKKMLKTSA